MAITATGWAIHEDVGGYWLGDVHELLSNTMVAVALAHVAGVVLARYRIGRRSRCLCSKSRGREEGGSEATRKQGLKRLIHTTNATEGLHGNCGRACRHQGTFPSMLQPAGWSGWRYAKSRRITHTKVSQVPQCMDACNSVRIA